MLIPLTKGQFAVIDDNDASLIGTLKWQAQWSEASQTYYAFQTYIDNGKKRGRYMHRMILGLSDRTVHVDHKNHNGLDNRRGNLRIATCSQNMANTRAKNGKASSFRGVDFDKRRKRWRAQITTGYKNTMLGYFNTETEAAQAYNNEALLRFGEFASLNDVPEGIPNRLQKPSRGVSFHSCGKWRAYVKRNGKQKHLGLYATEQEALSVVASFRSQENANGNHSAEVDKPSDCIASAAPELV